MKYLYSLPKYGSLIKRKVLTTLFLSGLYNSSKRGCLPSECILFGKSQLTFFLPRNERQLLLFKVLEDRFEYINIWPLFCPRLPWTVRVTGWLWAAWWTNYPHGGCTVTGAKVRQDRELRIMTRKRRGHQIQDIPPSRPETLHHLIMVWSDHDKHK